MTMSIGFGGAPSYGKKHHSELIDVGDIVFPYGNALKLGVVQAKVPNPPPSPAGSYRLKIIWMDGTTSDLGPGSVRLFDGLIAEAQKKLAGHLSRRAKVAARFGLPGYTSRP